MTLISSSWPNVSAALATFAALLALCGSSCTPLEAELLAMGL
jgi:hypothetical protein